MHLLIVLFRQQFLLAMRQVGLLTQQVFIFILIPLLITLGTTPDSHVLTVLAPGIIWIAVVFANLLSIDSLFAEDYEDGTLQQWLLLPQGEWAIVGVKVVAHWLVVNLPLFMMAPVMGLLFQMSAVTIGVLMATMVMGTFILTLLGGVISTLTLALKHKSFLLILLMMPLIIPVLIFSTSAVSAASNGLNVLPQLALLSAFMLISFAVCPWGILAGLKLSISQ